MTPLFDAQGRPITPEPVSSEPRPTGPNKLADSTSPYLLQHAMNPVDWHPWGPEALEKSRRLDRPILLSIGYAACHWCHVMEHESFEDPEIAALMNESFVNIKVDREERPDLDDIYMSAVQLLTGSGGWPLNVFLTPDLKPFYGGTYFPPDDRYGRPGMKRLIPEVARIYRERLGDVTEQAEELSRAVRALVGSTGTDESPERGSVPGGELLDRAAGRLIQTADTEWGGFGHAPKFPPSMGLSLLLRYNRRKPDNQVREIVARTLDRMAMGGMYDHVGGGFARYSTDERWLVPHFEKMLYDNALLVPVYADALRVLGEGEAGLYRRTIEDTLVFVERELTDPAGGFYSSLDADSEGEEGRFYVWSAAEVEEVLGAEAATFFAQVYDVSPEGNWEEKNIPWLRRPLSRLAREAGLTGADDEEIARAAEERLRPMRDKLLAARSKRVRPGLDDKVLTGWNGLMISAFARAAQALDRPEAAGPANRAADFLLGTLLRDGRLLRTWRRGHAHLNGYLEDYAFLAVGLVDLYETTFDHRRLDAAEALVETALRHFGDGSGGFYFTSDDHEVLLTRPRGVYDGAIPSGTSMIVQALLRLSLLLDRPEWRTAAEQAIAGVSGSLKQAPGGHHQMIAALDGLLDPPVEIAIVASRPDPAARELLRVVQRTYLPNRILAWLDPGDTDLEHVEKRIPLLQGKTMRDGSPTVYVCRNYACREPVTTAPDLTRVLAETSSRRS